MKNKTIKLRVIKNYIKDNVKLYWLCIIFLNFFSLIFHIPQRIKILLRKKKENKFNYFIKNNHNGIVAPYHIPFLIKIKPYVKKKCVLEIGGSCFPKKLLFNILKVNKWICVDYLENWAKGFEAATMSMEKLLNSTNKTNEFSVFSLNNSVNTFNSNNYIKFHGDASYISDIFYEKFDIVVSINAFEHILTLPLVINNIYNCLKKGGKLITEFGPIWSSALGHHYQGGNFNGVTMGYDIQFNNISKDGVPPFIHLLKNEYEIREYFKHNDLPYGQDQVDCLCNWCFHSNLINRLFYEDYEQIMLNSPFKKYTISSSWNIFPTEEILKKLNIKYPNNNNFEVCSIMIFAEK